MKKRFLALSLALCMLLSCVPFVSAASFSDIAGHWARESILAMADQNIITGYPDGTFRPNGTITRAELLTLVVRRYAANVTPSTILPGDVAAGDWYADTVRRALSADFIPDAMISDNRLNPGQAITREEAAAVLALALNLPASTASLTYADRAAISVWAVEAVAQCSENGIFGGYPDGGFHPQGTITRAEVAAVLSRADSQAVTPALPQVLNVSGTDGLIIDTPATLTITTEASVVRVQIRDSYGNVLGERAGDPASTWTISVRPVHEGKQSLTIHASTSLDAALSDYPSLTVPVTVTDKYSNIPSVLSAEPSNATPLSGSTVTVTATTNTAADRVALYDAAGVRVADTDTYTTLNNSRVWKLTYTVPAGTATRVLTVCAGDADKYYTDEADRKVSVTLKVTDASKVPAVTGVKASTETPVTGDTVTITVTTNLHASRVKLVDALGKVISEKTSGYSTSGSTRTWKFTMEVGSAGVSWVRAYAGSSNGYIDNTGGDVTLTISDKPASVRRVSASTTTPSIGQSVTITVTTDASVRRVKLTNTSGTTLNTTTTYRIDATSGLRVWTLTYKSTSTGQKDLRVYYGTSAIGNYDSNYSALEINVGSSVSGLSVSDVTLSTSTPSVGQAVTAYVTTDRQVSKLKFTDIFGNVLTTVSTGYTDSVSSRVWTVSLTPTAAGAQQYFVYPGNTYGYSSKPYAFAMSALPSAVAPSTAPVVNGVSASKTSISVGDTVTITVTTNASAEYVRFIDNNGVVVSSTGKYTTSGSSRVWTMNVSIIKAGPISGYVQAAGSGYDYSTSTARPLNLTVKYAGAPFIYSVIQEGGELNGFGICTLIVTTNQNVGSVSLTSGSGSDVSTDSYEQSQGLRVWTLSWTPAPSENTTVTVYAHGNGTVSTLCTWNR